MPTPIAFTARPMQGGWRTTWFRGGWRKANRIATLLLGATFAFGGVAPASAKGLLDLFDAHVPGSTKTIDHTELTNLLSTYVVPGDDGINRVRYARFKAEGHDRLKAYVKGLEAADPRTLDRSEQFAYWANLYNAKTIDIVLDHYPTASIKDISLGGGLLAAVTGGPWKAKVVTVSGMELSLDDIEHGLLRPIFRDPRVHYAVNCASLGCPNIGREAFTGARLDEQLNVAARAYVNHPRGVTVSNDEATVSSIYSWFAGDFGGDDEKVLAHLAAYADETLKRKLEGITSIADHRYDWSLNDSTN